MKKKLLLFHGSLTPYRLDFFNSLSKSFDLKCYFFYKVDPSQKFDTVSLEKQAHFSFDYILKGFKLFNRQFRFGIPKILAKENPNIIITHEFASFSLKVLVYKLIMNKSIRWFITSDDSLDTLIDLPLYRKIARKVILPHIDGLITINQEVKEWHYLNYPKLNLNIYDLPILHNDIVFRKNLEIALPISKNYIKKYDLNGKKVALFVGRLVAEKGILRLIDIVSSIPDKNFVLILVGDGILKNKIQEFIGNKRDTRIISPGRFDGIELLAWYNVASFFILPSYYEPFGAVVNEALVAGLPVLCSNKAGAKTLIKKYKNGELIDPLSSKDIRSKMIQFINKVKAIDKENIGVRSNLMQIDFNTKINSAIKFLTS